MKSARSLVLVVVALVALVAVGAAATGYRRSAGPELPLVTFAPSSDTLGSTREGAWVVAVQGLREQRGSAPTAPVTLRVLRVGDAEERPWPTRVTASNGATSFESDAGLEGDAPVPFHVATAGCPATGEKVSCLEGALALPGTFAGEGETRGVVTLALDLARPFLGGSRIVDSVAVDVAFTLERVAR